VMVLVLVLVLVLVQVQVLVLVLVGRLEPELWRPAQQVQAGQAAQGLEARAPQERPRRTPGQMSVRQRSQRLRWTAALRSTPPTKASAFFQLGLVDLPLRSGNTERNGILLAGIFW
jgi:hypothetical protein